MRVGALCAGYGGLELALHGLHRCRTVWVAETDPHASKVLDARFGAPNLGDLTEITDPPPVDVVTAGFPCQPVSLAGTRKGVDDERWLIADVCRVARAAGAQRLILENVAGLLSANDGDAMGRVCEAMAENGFVRWEWATIRASDVGAPHRRERWFCVATDTDVKFGNEWRQPASGQAQGGRPRADSRRFGPRTVADADSERLQERRIPERPQRQDVSDATGSGRFGPYRAAVDRWEHVLGRPAPDPLDAGRLNPPFVEWMMGLPERWVTGVDGISRSQQLRMLGNGVVPQQAAHAIRSLEALL